jgi:hypothetical protein
MKTATIEACGMAGGLARFRLDVKRPGEPLLPHSFHGTYEEAFDAGLLAIAGQSEVALEPRPGWDFLIVEATHDSAYRAKREQRRVAE